MNKVVRICPLDCPKLQYLAPDRAQRRPSFTDRQPFPCSARLASHYPVRRTCRAAPAASSPAGVSLDLTLTRRLDLSAMSLHPLAAEFIAPCLPSKTDKLPSGGGCMRSSTTASASSRARGWHACARAPA